MKKQPNWLSDKDMMSCLLRQSRIFTLTSLKKRLPKLTISKLLSKTKKLIAVQICRDW